MDLRRSWGNESGHRVSLSIASALVSAVLEWMLMFMLFVDASFAYFVTRFARHYQLRAPCLLCSRLDHVLGDERDSFYWDLICNEHKSKLASLALCQLQNPRVGSERSSSQLDQMPHVGYSQIRDNSDSESESPFSDTQSHEMETPVAKFVFAELSHHNVGSEAPIGLGGDSKDVAGPSDLIDFSCVDPSPNPDGARPVDPKQTNVDVECGETSNQGVDSTGTDELWKEVKTDQESNLIPPVEIQMDLKSNKTGSLDLGDAYRLAVGARGRQLSGRLEQQRSITDRVSEDLKLLLSHISAARGLDLSSNDISPKVSANGEDFRAVDAIGAQIFQRKISLERNESNLSLDGSIVGEIEDESDADRLKRQVEHDKKILATLYKELEEERNASAVAANQAMAMITRLQEEKAAFHMEALQCVRMLEEQAEYDGEALQKANVLLAENEKQIQRHQLELQSYRNRFGDVPSSGYESDELKEPIYMSSDIKTIDGTPKISLRQFEDEKQYILECLKTVEEKLFAFTKHEVYSDTNNRGFSTEESLDVSASHSQRENEEYGSKDVELAALRHELSVINNRLQALEAEQNVIECSISALDKGSEGFVFIREIATRLHDLHSAHAIKRMQDST
ncbi:myosin-binding protein 1-like [Salvia miltiorrhiza]|uniref:myosin-binding protein 1-like n=1 Tax=Salvia miltiorrhiza TaxID=226208 RepID=UPI0025ABFF4C|nr:myosin-binding protein 1-like [Salvia miltiorrhiza]XP_057763636.1 myosin-binding protein 1-like [Salvia miltiorrhiza]